MRITSLAAACLLPALSACGSGDAPVEIPPRTTQASLLVRCEAPVALPSRDLTGIEIEIMWGRDRSALRACGVRHAAWVSEFMDHDGVEK